MAEKVTEDYIILKSGRISKPRKVGFIGLGDGCLRLLGI